MFYPNNEGAGNDGVQSPDPGQVDAVAQVPSCRDRRDDSYFDAASHCVCDDPHARSVVPNGPNGKGHSMTDTAALVQQPFEVVPAGLDSADRRLALRLASAAAGDRPMVAALSIVFRSHVWPLVHASVTVDADDVPTLSWPDLHHQAIGRLESIEKTLMISLACTLASASVSVYVGGVLNGLPERSRPLALSAIMYAMGLGK